MGLCHDKIFASVIKGSFLFASRNRNVDVSKERGFYETDDTNIDSIGLISESLYTATSNYKNEENLVKLVVLCSKVAIYHHDDELLRALQEGPEEIVNLVAESEQIHPEEYVFFRRLKMMVLSIINVNDLRINYYPLE